MRRALGYGYHLAADLWARVAGEFSRADLSIFHQFAPPPAGGAHQFLSGLWRELEARGLKLESNRLSRATRACLFNSFNFDERRLGRLRRAGVTYVHRVDGPVDVYRGRDAGVDRNIWRMNQLYADRTVFQSHYSLNKHLEMGLRFRDPVVIPNAADPTIFHAGGRNRFSRDRRIRVISTSWSDNPNKGGPVYQWLDEHLDFDRFEYTFVGRVAAQFRNIRIYPPVSSRVLAGLLREHDIYLTASRHEACSNSLIEALSCGLPAIYANSGSNPELCGEAGFGFDAAEEIPALLERLLAEYETHPARIVAPTLPAVGASYLHVLGFGEKR